MNRQCFDDAWRFRHQDLSLDPASRTYDDSSWRKLNLPHDWSIERPRSADNPSAGEGGFFADGVGWYRKTFPTLPEWQDCRVAVEFEGIYRDAQIWLNGHYLCRHPYGYTSFLVDLAAYLNAVGEANHLVVRVDNSTHRHTRWYSGSGIYRHVWLLVGGAVHLEHWGVCVTTPEITAEQAVVQVETVVRNDGESVVGLNCVQRILSPAGGIAVEATQAVAATPGRTTISTALQLLEPALWSPESPTLYQLETEIRDGEQVIDRQLTSFGVRSFRFTPEVGFELNGETVPLRGGCVHHDCGPLGAMSIDRAEERKIEVLKNSGYNAVRCAHNPPAPAFLDACDRLGMLVIDEAFDVWRAPKIPYDYHRHFDEWWQRDLDSMLLRDRNHPAIVLWSIGNEVIERGLPEGKKIAILLRDRVKEIDPTRPVTAGICGLWDGGEWSLTDAVLAELDVCGYNYRRDDYVNDHERAPERVIIATESFPKESFEYWQAVENLPYVAGDFVWTALDYLGEAGIGHTFYEGEEQKFLPGWPWNQANCGDLDLCGWKRPQSWYRDVVWHRAVRPWIGVHPPIPEGKVRKISGWGWPDVQASWNWPGQDGKTMQVDVYFDCDEVELQLNGRPIGKRQPADRNARYMASFQVPYAPGILTAIAFKNGQEIARAELATAGKPIALRLTADRAAVRADRNDLVYVEVNALDTDGCLVPVAANEVFFSIQGPARIAAVASADPKNLEMYRGNQHSLWRGRALVVIQPDGEPGEIVLQAQADQLTPAEWRGRAT